jgi:hypothetical protein
MALEGFALDEHCHGLPWVLKCAPPKAIDAHKHKLAFAQIVHWEFAAINKGNQHRAGGARALRLKS